jgi:hypothetical protein
VSSTQHPFKSFRWQFAKSGYAHAFVNLRMPINLGFEIHLSSYCDYGYIRLNLPFVELGVYYDPY